MIDHVAAASIAGPVSPALLDPYRQPPPCLTVAKALVGVTRGKFRHRKETDLRHRIRFLNESVLDADFDIAYAKFRRRVLRSAFDERNNDVKLRLRESAIVVFERWRGDV